MDKPRRPRITIGPLKRPEDEEARRRELFAEMLADALKG
jgi:hypothetical protein